MARIAIMTVLRRYRLLRFDARKRSRAAMTPVLVAAVENTKNAMARNSRGRTDYSRLILISPFLQALSASSRIYYESLC